MTEPPIETTLERLKQMKLTGMVRALQASQAATADQRMSADELVEALVYCRVG